MALLPFDLPPGFLTHADRDDEWAAWVSAVPRLVRDFLDEWDLVPDGEPMYGHTALVVPVTASGERLALKIVFPHDEGQHEALALRHWNGNGTVRLVRADPGRGALLLERLSTRDLVAVPVLEACSTIAGLYHRLHVAAPASFAPLTSYIETWTNDLAGLPRSSALPRRIVEQAVHLGRTFVADELSVGRLIHGDLHYENVLAADREPWLVIDPKPVSGDPHYEIAPVLSDRWDEVAASGDVRGAVRRRFHTIVDEAGLSEQRARDWVIVREAHNAMWAIEDDDRERVTIAMSIIKAVQD